MPTYTGTNAAETIDGSSGDDVINGLRGNDVLNGLAGADRFLFNIGGGFAEGSDESDTIDGGDGEDRFEAVATDYPHYETGAGREVLPMTFSVMGGSGPGAGVAYFGMVNEGFFDGSPGGGSSRSVALRNVEVLTFDFTDDAPRPPFSVASNYYTYTTNDRFTIGDLTGTSVQRIELNFGHGGDRLDGSGATVAIIAHGEADPDTLIGGAADDQLFGDEGNDTLTGGGGDDQLFGGQSFDTLSGGGGNNRLDGGAELDTASYAGASTGVHVDLNDGVASNNGFGGQDVLIDIENLTGSAHNDVLIGQGGVNRLNGGDGSDYLIGLGGNDVLNGGAGVDTLQGGLGDDDYQVDSIGDTTLEFAGEGYDTVRTALTSYTLRDHLEALIYTGSAAFTGRGNGEANAISGGNAVDALYGLGGDDVLYGGGGSDQLYGGAGDDRLEGGAASGDTANYSLAASGVFVTMDQAVKTATNDGDGGVDILIDIENLTGSAFNDVLIGDGQANLLTGGAGADVLIGKAGNDVLVGGDGAANQMQGGVGDDTYRTTTAGDTLIENAGEGYDTVEAWIASYTLRANFERLNYRGPGNFTGTGNAENNVLQGWTGNDTLSGLAGADDLIGEGGNDVLIGGEGNDQLFGNDGDDVLRGGVGDDRLVGDAGIDTADYSTAAGAVTARLALNGSATDGDGGTDSLKDIENLTGSAFNDTLVGDAAGNVLNGGLGTDLLLGYGGNDTLIGGAGAANTMQGGLGDDVYVISTAGDTVVEFAGEGVDTVRTTLAAYVLKANFENLTNAGNGAFTGTGNAADNILTGGGGADLFTGLGGNDAFHGGGGVDTFVLSGVAADYAIVRLGDGTVRVTDNIAGRDGVDLLYADVERVRFGNGAILDLSTLAPAASPLSSQADKLIERLSAIDVAGGHGDAPLTLHDAAGHWDQF